MRSRIEELQGFKTEEEREVEGPEGKQTFTLQTTVDEVKSDDFGFVVKVSVDDVFPSSFRGGVDWARITRHYRIRVFNEGFVLFDCSRKELAHFIYPFQDKIIRLTGAFMMCTVRSDEVDKLIDHPKTVEIRASAFTDFALSSVSTGTLYGMKLETAKEFTDFRKRARLRTLMVRMSTQYGIMTMLITQDCGFVLYSKVPLDKEAEVFESLVKAIAIPMIE